MNKVLNKLTPYLCILAILAQMVGFAPPLEPYTLVKNVCAVGLVFLCLLGLVLLKSSSKLITFVSVVLAVSLVYSGTQYFFD